MLANTSSGNESDPEISNFWKLPIGHLNPDPMACLGRVMKIMGAFPWISSLLFKFLRHTKSEWDRDPAILRPGTHIFFYPSFVCCLFSVRPSLCLCSVCPAFCVSLSVSSSVPFVSKIRAYSISIVILWLAKDSKQLDLANQPSPTQRVPRAGLVCCFIFIFYFFFLIFRRSTVFYLALFFRFSESLDCFCPPNSSAASLVVQQRYVLAFFAKWYF